MNEEKKQVQKLSVNEKFERGRDILLGKYGEIDIPGAIMWLEAAAKQGEAKADMLLGQLYFEGKKVPQNAGKAILYLRRAANNGILEADYLLGVAYYYGKGTAINYEKALQRYQKALPLNKAEVYYELGECHINGNGCDKNAEKAIEYYEKASRLGHSQAKICLARFFMDGEYVARSYKKAFLLLCDGVKAGSIDANQMLGILYYHGRGTDQDYEKAIACFQVAAEADNSEGLFWLGLCYFEGKGLKKDEEKATGLIIRAAEAGYEPAYFYAGTFFYKGQYVDQDLVRTQYYFEKAQENGVEAAARYLEQVKAKIAEQQNQEVLLRQDEICQRVADAIKNEGYNDKQWDREEEDGEEGLEIRFNMGDLLNILEDGININRPGQRPANIAEDVVGKAKAITEDHIYGVVRAEKEKAAEAEALRKEFYMLRRKAESGDQESQYQVATAQFHGVEHAGITVVSSNLDESLYWFSQLASKGYPGAEEKRQKCMELLNEQYVQKIFEENQRAQQELRASLEAKEREKKENQAKSQLMARAAMNEFEALKQFAETENDEAEYLLGMAYLEGQRCGETVIVEPDVDEAVKWFAKASAHGHKEAEEQLIICNKQKARQVMEEMARMREKARQEAEQLAKEEKEKREREKRLAIQAAKNEFDSLVQFAETGNPEGMFYLAKSYSEGVTVRDTVIVEPNLELAIKFYTNSLRGGHLEAFERLAECQAIKAKQEKEKNELIQARAAKNEFEALVQFAESGNADGLYHLGESYLNGITVGPHAVVEVDIPKALECFKKAGKAGNVPALAKVVECQVILTREEAEKKARIAAQAVKNEFDSLVQFAGTGNADAQVMLAESYLNGVKSGEITVIEPNREYAIFWLNEAAENGNGEAMKKLEELLG